MPDRPWVPCDPFAERIRSPYKSFYPFPFIFVLIQYHYFFSPVPCASLLVRIVQAACHPNGRPKEVGAKTSLDIKSFPCYEFKAPEGPVTLDNFSCNFLCDKNSHVAKQAASFSMIA